MNFLQKMVDKKRAKQALAFFHEKKLSQPQLSENAISRLMLRNWVYRTSPMKNVEKIDAYIQELFKDRELTLVKACCFGITLEFPNVYSFYKNDGVDLDRHAKILEELEARVRSVIKI